MSAVTKHIRILGVVGSLRQKSFNRAALVAAQKLLAPSSNASLTVYGLEGIPVFNEDNERNPTEAIKKFKEAIRSHDAILFATPEYNYSIGGPLKNAIDTASRPYGDSAWAGKPVGIISASIGIFGGARSQTTLRQSLVFLGCPTMNAPEVCIGLAGKKFNDAGELTDEDTKKFLGSYVNNLVTFTREVLAGKEALKGSSKL